MSAQLAQALEKIHALAGGEPYEYRQIALEALAAFEAAPQQAQAPIDPDGEQSRAGFRAFDEAQVALWATPWQVWREAVKWAAQQAQAPGWQPIETAPKDGSLFMCWVSAVRYGETDEGQQYQQDVSQVDFCSWRTQADIPDCGWFDPCCGQIGDEQGVTHWMPLPAAPQQGSKS